MKENTVNILKNNFGISEKVIALIDESEREVSPVFEELDDIMTYNQYKVLDVFQKNRLADRHFSWNTGYGYDDAGREMIEKVYADVFHAEAALCRPTLVNGTHALAITLLGLLRPGDELIYCTGTPYDTLETVIGLKNYEPGNGSLKDYGVTYKQVELLPDGNIDFEGLRNAISDRTRMVTLQRSTGYGWRKAITIDKIEEWASFVSDINPDIIKMVDNSYGEFLDTKEPTDVGADVMAASLIKNPGGGLALTGAYVAGRKDLINRIQYRMTCPGIGGECGLTFGQTRSMFQGLFIAPRVVNGAVKGAVLCGRVFEKLGYDVCPKPEDKRSDIIEAVRLGTPEAVVSFCQGVQAAAPIDSYVKPIPWDMPGYDDQVVMAAGAFVQGSSIELSADAPIREPYNVYFQGGITYEHSKFGVIKALQALVDDNIITL
ncbi:MAG: methionine gamma-lyase family protein [Clostridiales bacterium]|nr:methionine gamma-lyase family protein [Clostridiales bacterium]MDY5976170.1 methionine gamma-lyase family protein [Anaerovoracaceae bacterium]